MPLYEYQCTCGNKFESIKSISDRHTETCSCCGNEARLIPSVFALGREAGWFRVYDCDGNLVKNKQTTERTPFKFRKDSGAIVNA